MPKPPNRAVANALEQVYAKDRAEWRAWLAANHSTSPGIWLVFDKKSSRADRLAYGDAVEEGLCFGWIDSTVRTLDDARYLQLFTPRKPKSTWSRSNKERVERLIAQGLMAQAGLAAIDLAKANGAWTSLDAVDAMVVPDDLATALKREKGAAANFAAFAPSARKGYLHWISQAVRPETRALRVAEVARRAASNQRNRFLAAPQAESSQAPAKKSAKKSAAKTPALKKSAATAKKSATKKRSASTKSAGKRKSR
ncbi:MAG TPA: YdeI/OmpD-associated family protein [Gemmatimonadaceae bacterium]|nr:YdeI/OmpD-associated family protein [Gemmatimonadaceae bacterium]